MEKIKAILHGTSTKHEEEKKAENAASHSTTHPTTGEGSHLGNATHKSDTVNTANTANVNPVPEGVRNTSGGLGQNTMKSDYNSTPTDGPLTTHGRHAEREAAIGSDGVNIPHRPRDSELGSTTTGMGASGLGGVGNGSNITGPNTQTHGVNTATGTSEAGLAAHNARGPLSSNSSGVPDNTASGLGGVTSIPSGNELNTHGRDNVGTSGTSSHHHGRDVALGSGAVGSAGLAEHEYRKHENTGLGPNTTGTTGTSGHHHGRDAALGSGAVGSAGLAEHEYRKHENTGLGSNTTGTTGNSGHHLGHDAAAIGTAGAVGEGIHHHHNTEHNQGGLFGGVPGPHSTSTANRLDPNLDSSTVRTEGAHTHHGHGAQSGRVEGGGAEEADGFHGAKGTSAGSGVVPLGAYEAGHGQNTTAGPHSSNLANKADPRVDSDLSKQQGHHYGRDAAIAGGVGGGAYEANKHLGNNGTATGNTTAGPHSSNFENKVDPRVDSDLSKQQGHHYGRDTAVAGGVGGAAYEADKHHHNHNTNTTAGPHSSNLENKADPRVDSDRSREQHHYGRDATLAGGAGTVAYEAEKHRHNHEKTTAGPHSSNLENKADPRVDSDRSKEGHHYGRDAALAGGAAGTAYEADKHHNTHGTDTKPVGKDIGDRLHGVERNRGVNGPTGFPHEGGHSINPGAIGTGVPGAPRGNVQDTTHPKHNSASAPDHIFTAPIMDDPKENSDLREGRIDQHEHRQHGASGVEHEHGHNHHELGDERASHHDQSKGKRLDNEINSAPLGNTSTTPGSNLRDNTYNTSSGTTGNHGSGLTGQHNTTSTGTTGLNHGSGLTGQHNTSTGTTGLGSNY